MDNEVRYLYLDDIIPNRFQPRENFDEQALKELAVSIKEHGVIQPIVVRQIGEKYEIIAGERRYKASTMAGLTKIPAIIKNLDDKESSKVALIENLQRRDLTAIEEARTYQKILELDALTQEELARTMGKSQSAVSNKLRLLSLTDEVQDALLHEQISERHARSLLNVTNPEMQKQLLNKIISSRMTVRELDEEIKNMLGSGNNSQDSGNGGNNNSVVANAQILDSTPQSNYNDQKNTTMDTNNVNSSIGSSSLFPNFGNVQEQTKESDSSINNVNNVLDSNNIIQTPKETQQNESPLIGGNLFSNISSEPSPTPAVDESNKNDVDVIGGSGLLAGINSSETVMQPNENNNKNNIGLENNLYQNFDNPMSNNQSNSQGSTEKTIPTIVNEFKDVVSNIKSEGKNVELEEFDFDDFYQLVIRIDK